jgi:hypothetical protein
MIFIKYLKMIILFVVFSFLSSCSCTNEPADLGGATKKMKFKIFTIGNDPQAISTPCIITPNDITDMEVQLGSIDGNNDPVDKYLFPTINSDLSFEVDVPETGIFLMTVRIEMDCSICCNSFFVNRAEVPSCANKDGTPIFESIEAFQYANETVLITPVLKRCKCNCN